MSATQELVTTATATAQLVGHDELELSGSEDLPRRLVVERHSGYIYASVYGQKTRECNRAEFVTLAHSAGRIEECSILTGSTGSKSLIVRDAYYRVTDEEARKLVEAFGLREWS